MPLDASLLLQAAAITSPDMRNLVDAINQFTEAEVRASKAKEDDIQVRQREVEIEMARQGLERERLRIEEDRNRLSDDMLRRVQALTDVVSKFIADVKQEHHEPTAQALRGIDARMIVILEFLTMALPVILAQGKNEETTARMERLLKDAIRSTSAPTVQVGGQHTTIDAERDVSGVNLAGKDGHYGQSNPLYYRRT